MASRSAKSLSRRRLAIAEVLEPRVLYSVDALGPLAPFLGDELPIEASFDLPSVQPHTGMEAWADASDKSEIDQPESIGIDDQDDATQSASRQLAFIDAGVPDVDRVVDALEQSGIDVVIIEADDDGLLVISQVLAGRDDVTAVHVISHGSSGSLILGNTALDAKSVESNAAAITRWGDALSDDADILFYGCELAANDEGVALVDRIAQLTVADVAASDDLTGHASLGADWDLELATGTIETLLFGDGSFRQDWLASLDTIIVTTTDDIVTVGTLTTDDLDSMSEVSLRDAIAAANNTPGHHTIILDVGAYELIMPEVPFVGDVGNGNLDLEVDNDGTTSSLIIRGAAGEGLTNIIQTQNDRILFLKSGELTLEHLTITGGQVNGSGGGISMASSTVLNTAHVTFDGNESIGAASGGGAVGVGVQATATFVDTTFVNNKANVGGGIASNGTLVLQNTTFVTNQSLLVGGGLFTQNAADSSLVATDVMFTSNRAGTDGGAIELQVDDAVINRVTFYDNSAAGSGGAIKLEGANAVITNATFSENYAAIGGAMVVEQDATVSNSTFYQNYDTSFADAGAIRIASGTVTIANNVFDNNYTGDISNKLDVNGDVISAGFNIFTTFTSVNFLGGQAGTDIALQPLGLTMDLELLAPSDGYVSTHAPMAGSQVINTGGSTEYTTDATGSLRDQIPDAGAHEYKPVTAVKFWIDTSGDIWRSNVDGSNIRLIVSTMESSVAATRDIEVDFTNGRIYWIAETGVVQSTSLDGSVPVSDVIVGLTATTGIAIDSFNNRLFVADRGTKEILSYGLDTSGAAPIATAATTVTTTINEVNDIEFDAVSNILIWTETVGNGLDGRVVSRALDSSTDGDDSTNIDVYTYSGNPDGLTLDELANRIFVVYSTSREVLLINYAGELLENVEEVDGQRIEYDVLSGQVIVSEFEPGSGFDYIAQELTIPFFEPVTSGPEALAIGITSGIDLPPTMGVPMPVEVVQGDSTGIDGTKLSSSDDINSPSQLKWEMVDFPTYGVIVVDGVDLATLPVAQQYFTQEQIDDGLSVVYQHDGSTTSATDFITVRLTDGTNTTSTLQLDFNVEATPVFTSSAVFNVDENVTSVGTVETTDVDGGAPQYTLVGTVDDTLMSIDINTGALSFNTAPDFESAADTGGDNVYNVTVQADDGNGGIVTQALNITVGNVNEFSTSAISDTDASADSVAENSVAGTRVGITGFAEDQDAPDTVNYTLDNDGGGLFVIDGVSGVVTLSGALDYESATSHDITVRASSTDSTSTTQDYTIAVGDVNDVAPVVTPAQTLSIAENAAANDVVGSVIATDADTVGSLQAWTITGGNADGVFQIDAATGQITIADTTHLDYETSSQYTLSVEVSDGVNTSAVENVVIDINDVNDTAPIVTPAQTLSIAENASPNDVVGSVIATDEDTIGSLQAWTITGGNADGVFQIDAATGQITIADTTHLDYETSSQYTLSVQVSDGFNTSAAENVVIDINDVNDTAPIVTPAQTLSVAENAVPNDVVGSVIATDADTVGSLQAWTITGGNADGVFQIDAATGQITIADTTHLDYETSSQYSLSVEVSDGVNTSAVEDVVININDVNEVPEFTSLPVVTATEDIAYSYSISSNDVDGDSVSITGVALPAWLTLTDHGDGTATLIGTPTNTEVGPHSIDLQLSDGALVSTQSFTLTVSNVNDEPVFTSPAVFNVDENVTSVGTVVTTDVDGGAPQYTLVGTVDDTLMSIDINSGALSFNTAPDFESAADTGGDNVYNVTVQADDGNGGVVTQALSITVRNANEFSTSAVSDTDASADSIAENSVAGTRVGITGFAEDHDAPATVRYTLDNDGGGLFLIDEVSGVVTLNGAVNYEGATSHDIRIRATSEDSSFSIQDYTITVGDMNDVAPIVTPAPPLSIAENASSNDVVGSAIATDADTVGSLQAWTIIGGNADGVFQINAATGQITIADTTRLDYETRSQYTLSVQVSDGVNTSAAEDVVIDISDVNEAPRFTSLPLVTATEGTTYNYSISSDDVDGDDVSIAGVALPAWLTLTDHGDGTATLSGTPTNDEVGPHSITLQLSDGTLISTRGFTLTVNSVNDEPVFTSPTLFDVNENDTSVGTVVTTDVDGGAPEYTLVGTVDDALMSIDINTGALSFNTAPNFESAVDAGSDNVYNVTVQADDGNGGIVTQGLSISVRNVNEFTTSAISDTDALADSISENSVTGGSVGVTGFAEDQDAPDTVSYTLDNDGGGLFEIDGESGVVTLNGLLDYESATSHDITVRATSTDSTFTTREYTIVVGDVNDVAPVVTPAQTLSIAENASPNDVVGSVIATDADTVGSLQAWTITGGNADGVFQINAVTGQITIADTTHLDYGTSSQYTLSVQVGDGVNTSAVEDVVIDINDVNEVPRFTSLPLVTATEDTTYNYSISSNDVDGDNVSITGVALPAWLTLTDHGDGTATLSGTPTNDEVGLHGIDLQLSDGVLVSTQSFTLTVNNVNNAPHSLVLDNATVAENRSDVRIGILSSIDHDPGDIVSYFVDDSRFEIRDNELFLGQDSELDFESEALVPLQITAIDRAGASATQTFTISVTDQNDAPVLINELDIPIMAEGAAYQIPANTFGDVDGDTLSYTAVMPSGEALPDWVQFRESTAEFVLIDTAGAPETLLVELIADDNRGGRMSIMIELRFEPAIAAAEPAIVPASDLLTVVEMPTNVATEPETDVEVSEESLPEEIPEELFPAESETDMLIEEVDLASLIQPALRTDVVTLNDAEDVVTRLLNVRTDSQTEDNVDSINLSTLFAEPGQIISRDYTDLVDSLDNKREEMAEKARFAQTLVGSSVGVTSGLSVGYLIWLIRGGTLMGSMLSSLPAWRLVDPLPVLGSLGASDDDEDESLESMVDDTSISEDPAEPPPDSSLDADNQQDD